MLLALTESPTTAVIAGVLFLGYQQFENNVVGPAIVGSAVNLTPPATMLAALDRWRGGRRARRARWPRRCSAPARPSTSRAGASSRRARDAALKRRLQARLDKVKQAAGDLTDTIKG